MCPDVSETCGSGYDGPGRVRAQVEPSALETPSEVVDVQRELSRKESKLTSSVHASSAHSTSFAARVGIIIRSIAGMSASAEHVPETSLVGRRNVIVLRVSIVRTGTKTKRRSSDTQHRVHSPARRGTWRWQRHIARLLPGSHENCED